MAAVSSSFGIIWVSLLLGFCANSVNGCGDVVPTLSEIIGNSNSVLYARVVRITPDPPTADPAVNTSTVLVKVLCVLKGEPQPHYVNITKAGRRGAGHCFTNEFHVDETYVTFLRLKNGAFIPDEREVTEDKKSDVFHSCGLSDQNTCPGGLTRVLERPEDDRVVSECPHVSVTTCAPVTDGGVPTKPPKNPPVPTPTTTSSSPVVTPPQPTVFCVEEKATEPTKTTPPSYGITTPPSVKDGTNGSRRPGGSCLVLFSVVLAVFGRH